MTRLMIFVQRPRHVSSEEAEAWLEDQLAALDGNGVEGMELKPLLNAPLRFSESWAWVIELRCADPDAAWDSISSGTGCALLADLRMLGMRPSVAVVADAA